jgi:nucleoside phosphorylase
MIKTAIIAALEREIHPLVKRWPQSRIEANGRTLTAYRSGELLAVAGGIGSSRAERAARAVVGRFRPEVLVSAGLAGALIHSLKAGSVVTPNVIVDAATGVEYRCDTGGELVGSVVLVSAGEIAGQDSKLALVERYHGLIVDMEAAGVAQVAAESNLAFHCVKAISDELDFVMPPLNRFVDSQGDFSTKRLIAWAMVRPHRWLGIMRLARNTTRATQALCDWLRQNATGEDPPAAVVTLERRTQSDSVAAKDALRTDAHRQQN